LGVIFNIEKIKDPPANSKIVIPYPFEIARETIKRFITLYNFKEISEVQINDIANKRQRYYSLPALMESTD
jgi:hypothetical protein